MLDIYSFDSQGCLQLRYINNGLFTRELRNPGSDISDLPVEVQEDINLLWTPEFISNWQIEHTPEPVPPQPLPVYTVEVTVLAELSINGDDITGVELSNGLAGAFRETIGRYWCFFANTMPDTRYMALAYDGGLTKVFVAPEDKFDFGCIVTAFDLDGNPTDLTHLNLEVKRVV